MNLMAMTIVIVTDEDPAAVKAEVDALLDGMIPRVRAAVVDFHPAMKLVPAPQVQLVQLKSPEDLAKFLQKSGN